MGQLSAGLTMAAIQVPEQTPAHQTDCFSLSWRDWAALVAFEKYQCFKSQYLHGSVKNLSTSFRTGTRINHYNAKLPEWRQCVASPYLLADFQISFRLMKLGFQKVRMHCIGLRNISFCQTTYGIWHSGSCVRQNIEEFPTVRRKLHLSCIPQKISNNLTYWLVAWYTLVYWLLNSRYVFDRFGR